MLFNFNMNTLKSEERLLLGPSEELVSPTEPYLKFYLSYKFLIYSLSLSEVFYTASILQEVQLHATVGLKSKVIKRIVTHHQKDFMLLRVRL